MTHSDEALELAEKIDCGKALFFPDEIYDEIYNRFCDHDSFEWFGDNGNFKEHRIIALCLYAAILKDEGK